MTHEITATQAGSIHDIESYKTVTGAKRFKRTAEEMQLGLSPEEALKRRLAAFDPGWLAANQIAKNSIAQAKAGLLTNGPTVETWKRLEKAVNTHVASGDVVIRIRAKKGVSPDYFEHLPEGEIVVEQDNAFYGWLDVKLGGQYGGEVAKFFTDLLDQGIGELIDHPNFKQE